MAKHEKHMMKPPKGHKPMHKMPMRNGGTKRKTARGKKRK